MPACLPRLQPEPPPAGSLLLPRHGSRPLCRLPNHRPPPSCRRRHPEFLRATTPPPVPPPPTELCAATILLRPCHRRHDPPPQAPASTILQGAVALLPWSPPPPLAVDAALPCAVTFTSSGPSLDVFSLDASPTGFMVGVASLTPSSSAAATLDSAPERRDSEQLKTDTFGPFLQPKHAPPHDLPRAAMMLPPPQAQAPPACRLPWPSLCHRLLFLLPGDCAEGVHRFIIFLLAGRKPHRCRCRPLPLLR